MQYTVPLGLSATNEDPSFVIRIQAFKAYFFFGYLF
jgi:hypothetical protein